MTRTEVEKFDLRAQCEFASPVKPKVTTHASPGGKRIPRAKKAAIRRVSVPSTDHSLREWT